MIEDNTENTNKYGISVRDIEKFKKGSGLLTELLTPVVQGFPFINLDMAFSNLDNWDMWRIENATAVVAYCYIHNFKQSQYLKMAEIETILISRRSKAGKSMNILTETVTHNKQEYTDSTPKKFDVFGFGKNNNK